MIAPPGYWLREAVCGIVLFWRRSQLLSTTHRLLEPTLDVLHVAAAKLIGAMEFCTFDVRQSSLAGWVGSAPSFRSVCLVGASRVAPRFLI